MERRGGGAKTGTSQIGGDGPRVQDEEEKKRRKEEEEVKKEERKKSGTHRDLSSAGLAVVEGVSHHVSNAIQLTYALVIVECQLGVVNVPVLQQTHSQADGGRVHGADRGVAWRPQA